MATEAVVANLRYYHICMERITVASQVGDLNPGPPKYENVGQLARKTVFYRDTTSPAF